MKALSSQQAAQLLRRITMTEMRALLAIKSAGSLTRAAIDLGVSQPALSQQLREIEDKLGTVLFVRHRRGLEPTVFGTVMLRLAAAMGVDIHIAAEELALASRQDDVPIRIGSMAVTSAGLLAVALGRFAQQPHRRDVVLMEGSREVLLEHLRHRRIDIFVGRLPTDDSVRDLVAETLSLGGAVVIAAHRHPLRRRARLTMPAARIHPYSMLAIPAVVNTSEMLAFLPTSMFAAGTMSAGLQRLDVDLDWIASPVGVLMHRDPASAVRLSSLLGLLRSVAASARNAMANR